MLDFMRRHAKNWLVKALLGIIILVFIFYFGSMGSRQKVEAVAVIDGSQISLADYYKEYEQLIDNYRRMAGGTLSDEILKKMDLKQQALDGMIDRAIIVQEAQKNNINVTNDEIRSIISSYPMFQRDGVFDENIYRQALRYEKMTPEEFEAIQRRSLVALKLQNLIQDGVKVSDREIHDYYALTNERISVDLISLRTSDYEGMIKPSPSDFAKYLKDHGSEFRIPEQAQVKYLVFSPADYAGQATINESDISEYYERNKGRYAKHAGKTVNLSQAREEILAELKHREGMTLASREAKKAHDTIYQSENFDGYAAQNHLQVHETGFFISAGIPETIRAIPDIDKTIFGLMKDEISPVLSTDSGYYVLKLVAKKSAYVPSLSEVRGKVEKRCIAKEAEKLCRKDAESLLDRLRKGGAPDKVVGRKMTITETGFFQIKSGIPKLGATHELMDALYGLSEKKPFPDKVFFLNGQCLIVKFKERERLDDSDFASKKEALKNQFMAMKKSEIFRTWLDGTKRAMLQEGRLKYKKDAKEL
jgi:peptidyl-prolyl cis-trans isomerase D